MKWIVKWLLCAAALLLVAQVYSGVQLQNFTTALIAALVLGLFNTLLRPVLIVLTLLNVIGPWGWLGIIAIATGVFRFCPAYTILGVRTCPMPAKDENAV